MAGRKKVDVGRFVEMVRGLLVEGDPGLSMDPGYANDVALLLGRAMTTDEVCAELGIKPNGVRYHVRRGSLRAFTDGSSILFLPEDVASFRRQRRDRAA